MVKPVGTVVLLRKSRSATRGLIAVPGITSFCCSLGRTGIGFGKREGDGATPAGHWRPLKVLYRSDRTRHPRTTLPVSPIRRHDGWCDAIGDRNYNRPVTHPYPVSAERLARDDHLYDLILVIDHNTRPRIQGRGSAVFVHLARPGFAPTEGCIALRERDMRWLLSRLTRRTRLLVA